MDKKVELRGDRSLAQMAEAVGIKVYETKDDVPAHYRSHGTLSREEFPRLYEAVAHLNTVLAGDPVSAALARPKAQRS